MSKEIRVFIRGMNGPGVAQFVMKIDDDRDWGDVAEFESIRISVDSLINRFDSEVGNFA